MTVSRLYTRNGTQSSPGTKIDADVDNTNNYVNAHEASTATHGATGAVVGTTNVQALTNKTLTSPTINSATLTGTVTANTGVAIDATATTQTVIDVTADSLTTGALANFNSNSSDVSARDLVTIVNDHADADSTNLLKLKQDADGNILAWYTGANLSGRISSTGIIHAGMLVPGQTVNLGLARTATTFKITSASGTALSASNPGFVCVPSVTGGYNVVLSVTADVTADYDADFVDSRLGATTSVNWGNDFPYFFGFVNEDDTSANAGFFGTRSPCMKVTPAAGLIHDTDANAADLTQNSIHGFWADDAGKAAKPCVIIGAARMTITGATNKFVPTALTAGQDGIGQCYINAACSTFYIMPTGQNGAKASNYINSTGGQIPTWATPASIIYNYTIDRYGYVTFQFSTSAAGNCTQDGAAAGDNISLYLPYATTANQITGLYLPSGTSRIGGAGNLYQGGLGYSASSAAVELWYNEADVWQTVIETSFAVAADDLFYYATYKAF